MAYWTAVNLMKQLSGELGLPVQNTIVNADNPQGSQLLAALNSAGNELLAYYPWAQFASQWEFDTVYGQGEYDVPSDWRYFTDQTQWDRTNHWPLLGPMSPAEWSYLKGGIVASFPRTRWRVVGTKFTIFPIPESDSFKFAMEYIRSTWVQRADSSLTDMVIQDGDTCLYDPWLLIKFTKLKFYQLKGFDTKAVEADFTRMFESLTGKDVGARTLSLVPLLSPVFIGPQSIPDGNWNV